MTGFNAPKDEALDDRRVAKGVDFLDTSRRAPADWRTRITRPLDMGSAKNDVLGQIGTTFEKLGLTLAEAITHGFEPTWDEPEYHARDTAAWLRHFGQADRKVA